MDLNVLRKRLKSVAQPHSGAWLTAPPLHSYGMEFPNREFQVAALRWLGAKVNGEGSCVACTEYNNCFADHAVRCACQNDRIVRHNRIRDVLCELAHGAALAPQKEKSHILGDTPGRRPGDIFLPCFGNGAPLAIDVAITDPLLPKYSKVDCPAEDYAVNIKHVKYDEGFRDTGIDFCAAVVDIFGWWNAEGFDVISEIARRGADRSGYERSSYICLCWQRLSVALQISNARMVGARIGPPVV